jgi:photosystem II stability/assembly factor-like uncharacterized protein
MALKYIMTAALAAALLFKTDPAPVSTVKSGQKMFVAAGETYKTGGSAEKKGVILTSKDGASWKKIFETKDSTLGGVAAGSGRIVAVGDKGLSFSKDGQSWSGVMQPATLQGELTAVAFGSGIFVAVASSSQVWFSSDGEGWSMLQDDKGKPLSLDPKYCDPVHLYGVVFLGGKFLALGSGDRIVTFTVKDGKPVLEGCVANGKEDAYLHDMAFGAGRYVAVGMTGSYLSTDLKTWTRIVPSKQYYGVAYGKDTFVAVSGYASWIPKTGEIMVSATGESKSWKQAAVKLKTGAFRSVAYGNGTYVVVGNGGLVFTSGDAAKWKKQPSSKASLRDIIFIE